MDYDTNVVSNFEDPTGFVTYIDESGDEGFVFDPDGSGSSRWFVLSAVVTRRINDLQMVECLREARKVLGKAPKTPLHFADLRHEQRVPYIRRVGDLDIRTINIAVYKPAIGKSATFQGNKNLLYRYTTRFLVERLSWLLSRTSTGTPGHNRFTEVIFPIGRTCHMRTFETISVGWSGSRTRIRAGCSLMARLSIPKPYVQCSIRSWRGCR